MGSVASLTEQQFDTLKRLGTATLHEALGQRRAVSSRIAPLDPSSRLVGRALTVDSKAGDNLMLHYAVSKARPGDVLVVDAKGFMEAGMWGDILTAAGLHAGIAGLVVDGAVRDASAIVDLGFPVFCRGLSINGPSKNQPGRLNVPVVVGDCLINPGDIVVGDRDGLVALAPDEVVEAIRRGEEREHREAGFREQIAAGRTTVDLFGLRDLLARLGLE